MALQENGRENGREGRDSRPKRALAVDRGEEWRRVRPLGANAERSCFRLRTGQAKRQMFLVWIPNLLLLLACWR